MRSGLRAAAGLVVGAALVGGCTWENADRAQEQPGTQIASPAVSIGEAESQSWSVLSNEAGVNRSSFPRPLVAQDAQLCFGFERLDFGEPARPSVARCVDGEGPEALPEGTVASVFGVKAGLDVWHVLAFGAPVDDIDIILAGGSELPSDRIFVGDRVIALRLGNDMRVEAVAWTDGQVRYRCDAAPDVVISGDFCT